jgi:hypothetical protein
VAGSGGGRARQSPTKKTPLWQSAEACTKKRKSGPKLLGLTKLHQQSKNPRPPRPRGGPRAEPTAGGRRRASHGRSRNLRVRICCALALLMHGFWDGRRSTMLGVWATPSLSHIRSVTQRKSSAEEDFTTGMCRPRNMRHAVHRTCTAMQTYTNYRVAGRHAEQSTGGRPASLNNLSWGKSGCLLFTRRQLAPTMSIDDAESITRRVAINAVGPNGSGGKPCQAALHCESDGKPADVQAPCYNFCTCVHPLKIRRFVLA